MKALIFNSGLGSRLGELTKDKPKSMVQLENGETIFHRQLRILHACGISEFIVTTGPFAEQLEAEAKPFKEIGCAFSFVPNPVYDETNYIYSMYLARDLLIDDSFLLLHGDLVFDAAYAQMVVDSEKPSIGSVNIALPQPEKDFKARIIDGEVREVSVKIFDDDCLAFQPFYKLSANAIATWVDAIKRFVDAGETGVYAENAANTVFEKMHVDAFSYEGHYVEEVDTPEDLTRVSEEIRLYDFIQQPIYRMDGSSTELIDGSINATFRGKKDVASLLSALRMTHPLVVTAPFFPGLSIAKALSDAGVPFNTFTDFNPNPTYEDVSHALKTYREAGCDSLLSVGGGSAIDIAKCVKQLLAMPEDPSGQSLKAANLPYADTPHVAVPTTAGTGSESTHFAVCYVDGQKVSVANDCLQPNAVLLDASNLTGLPNYQKKCTLLDALCQAIESYWSVKSCEQSRTYSSQAIPSIISNAEAYLAGKTDAAAAIMRAANFAGKAINLTTTTAPHAMSYKLTSMYGIPHGHAVAICMPYCWQALIERADKKLQQQLSEIAKLITGNVNAAPCDGLSSFDRFFDKLDIEKAVKGKPDDIDVLASSVNLQRLKNFPMALTTSDIREIYNNIVIY